jgi:hypothetical protein
VWRSYAAYFQPRSPQCPDGPTRTAARLILRSMSVPSPPATAIRHVVRLTMALANVRFHQVRTCRRIGLRRYGPILLQKSAGSVRPNFPGPWECGSKKRVGDHPTHCLPNERPPQLRYNGFEQHLLISPRFEAIFVTLHFSIFATKSARNRHPRRNPKWNASRSLVF